MKGLFLWVAGVGFSLTEVYFCLVSFWAKAFFWVFVAGMLYVLYKLPKEWHLLFWVILTLVTMMWYYAVKPAETWFAGF